GQKVSRHSWIGVNAVRDRRDPRVSGCTENLVAAAVARQLPRKRVLPCTPADDKNLQGRWYKMVGSGLNTGEFGMSAGEHIEEGRNPTISLTRHGIAPRIRACL